MGINNLPKAGINFRAATGAGNFAKKLGHATRYGDLKNLEDNKDAIVEAVKKYQAVIRTRGGLSRLQQRSAWLEIKKRGAVTKEDRGEIKQILKHLGRNANDSGRKPAEAETSVKASDGKSYLTEAQVKKNVLRNKARDESGAMSRGTTSEQFAGGRIVSHGVYGAKEGEGMEGLGVKRDRVGFAADSVNTKLSNNSAPKAPPGGIRPLGM